MDSVGSLTKTISSVGWECSEMDNLLVTSILSFTSSVNIFVTGVCWQLMPGGGSVVGHINEDGLLSGSNIAYIYPDNVTALVGQFLNCTFVR